MAFDKDGNLYVSDYANGRVQVISPAGEILGVCDPSESGMPDFGQIWSVAVGPDGRVYATDENFENGKVAVIHPASYVAPEASPAAPVASPSA